MNWRSTFSDPPNRKHGLIYVCQDKNDPDDVEQKQSWFVLRFPEYYPYWAKIK